MKVGKYKEIKLSLVYKLNEYYSKGKGKLEISA